MASFSSALMGNVPMGLRFPSERRQRTIRAEWKEECGVVGIYGDIEASKLCCSGLQALQHRGQEGAGIVTWNNNRLHSLKGLGLVSQVFDDPKLSRLQGDQSIGHVRYGTAGSSDLENVQPLMTSYEHGEIAVAHNGNLGNSNILRHQLEKKGSVFISSSDTEVVLHLIQASKATSFVGKVIEACEQLHGAYSMLFLSNNNLLAIRDPYGFRPLVMGCTSKGAIVFASETCAFYKMGVKFEREVNPGEVILVNEDGVSNHCLTTKKERKACSFEHIYFSQLSSRVFNLSVYETRYTFGQMLAMEAPVECDVVVPVQASGTVAGLGYAAKLNVPFHLGLDKLSYHDRTFMKPCQELREIGVKDKFAPIEPILQGKRVVLVDDSIVRGTTCSRIVKLIKDAGAREVHVRIACPPIIGPCYYGVNTPKKEELIMYRLSEEEACKVIGADSLAFLPLSKMHKALGKGFCDACFSGNYPIDASLT